MPFLSFFKFFFLIALCRTSSMMNSNGERGSLLLSYCGEKVFCLSALGVPLVSSLFITSLYGDSNYMYVRLLLVFTYLSETFILFFILNSFIFLSSSSPIFSSSLPTLLLILYCLNTILSFLSQTL